MKRLIIGLAMIILAALLGIFLLSSLVNRERYYRFGQEIRNFPIEKASITFTAWTATKAFDEAKHWGNISAPQSYVFIIVNYTVRNIGDTEFEIANFSLAKTPLLKYGNYYASCEIARSLIVGSDYSIDLRGITTYWSFYQTYGIMDKGSMWEMPTPVFVGPSIGSNVTLSNGFIYFQIPEGCQPAELVFPSKDSQQTIIKIT
jgi:hypothetical protein